MMWFVLRDLLEVFNVIMSWNLTPLLLHRVDRSNVKTTWFQWIKKVPQNQCFSWKTNLRPRELWGLNSLLFYTSIFLNLARFRRVCFVLPQGEKTWERKAPLHKEKTKLALFTDWMFNVPTHKTKGLTNVTFIGREKIILATDCYENILKGLS